MGLEKKVRLVLEETTEHKVKIGIKKDFYEVSLLIKKGVLTQDKETKEVRFRYHPEGDFSKNIYLVCLPGTTIGWLPNLMKYRGAWERLNNFLSSSENQIQNEELVRYSIKSLSEHLKRD